MLRLFWDRLRGRTRSDAGIGMILVIPQTRRDKAVRVLKRLKEPFYEIGRVIRQPRGRKDRVIYK